MPVETVGLHMAREDIRVLASKLGLDANAASWQLQEKDIDDLNIAEAMDLKRQLTMMIDKQQQAAKQAIEKSRTRQTMSQSQPEQEKKTTATAVNVEVYSSNFFYQIEIEGQTFAAQMTIRGGRHGGEHFEQVLKAMHYIVGKGGKARGRVESYSHTTQEPAREEGPPWELTMVKGRTLFKLNRGEAPKTIECPIHKVSMKYGSNEQGKSFFHKDNSGNWCRINFTE